MTALAALRQREINRLAGLLDAGGLLLVHGPDAQESGDIAAAAVANANRVNAGEVDLDACADDQEVAREIARAAATALVGDRLLYLPEDRRSAEQQRTWLNARRVMGDTLDLLTSDWAAPPPVDPAELIASAVDALGRAASVHAARPVLVLIGVDALIDVPRSRFTNPAGLLWSMRSAAQSAQGVTLVLAGGPASIELVSDRDTAFFGWGRPMELRRVDTQTMCDAFADELGIQLSLAVRAAELSEGLPRVARLLARCLSDTVADAAIADPVQAAWESLLREQASSLRITTRLLAEIHRAALPVCQALAAGRAPYRAAHSGEVTRVLKVLHAHGVCEIPKPRTWRLTDPLLGAWLRGHNTLARQAPHAGAAP